MSDENKIRDAADAIKGIAEAVPVYQDVVQPAAKEIGTALQTAAKTIHVALAPVSALVWGYERIKDYLTQALAERLKTLPEERIVTPNPAVAGPVIEALRFSAHEPTLRELYANLLATAMDAKTASNAHPAFVEIIRQVTPDEARLLKYLSEMRSEYAIPLISGYVAATAKHDQTTSKVWNDLRHFSLIGQQAGCTYPDSTESYLDNLCRLGLIDILPYEQSVDYEQIFYTTYDELEQQARQELPADFLMDEKAEIECHIKREVLDITALGWRFWLTCVDDTERA